MGGTKGAKICPYVNLYNIFDTRKPLKTGHLNPYGTVWDWWQIPVIRIISLNSLINKGLGLFLCLKVKSKGIWLDLVVFLKWYQKDI